MTVDECHLLIPPTAKKIPVRTIVILQFVTQKPPKRRDPLIGVSTKVVRGATL